MWLGWKTVAQIYGFGRAQEFALVAGNRIPTVDLHELQSEGTVSLGALAKPGRPVLLNFGSCS